jgi:hypothetical protein
MADSVMALHHFHQHDVAAVAAPAAGEDDL